MNCKNGIMRKPACTYIYIIFYHDPEQYMKAKLWSIIHIISRKFNSVAVRCWLVAVRTLVNGGTERLRCGIWLTVRCGTVLVQTSVALRNSVNGFGTERLRLRSSFTASVTPRNGIIHAYRVQPCCCIGSRASQNHQQSWMSAPVQT